MKLPQKKPVVKSLPLKLFIRSLMKLMKLIFWRKKVSFLQVGSFQTCTSLILGHWWILWNWFHAMLVENQLKRVNMSLMQGWCCTAARCKLIKSTEEKMAEPDICSGHKKPPRKGRKKMQTSHDYQASTVGELSESLEGEEDAVSESNADEQTSFSSNGRGRLQRRPTVDLGVATRHLGKEEQRLNPNPCRQQALCDGPTPLATKIYHFQGSRRLRSALGQLYMEAVNGCQARDLSSRRQVNDPRQQGS
ncbi:uncharacterized protein LOC144710441 isoform X4 [Wolffia australiana]